MITTIIEKYLIAIDQATFQKMMNHLLYLEGYKFIGSPGSVVGKNKTSKGSPDSFFEDDENYVFCELTTQERLATGETFFTKLKKDVEHCFNTKATGIDKLKVSKVILAFTEEIKPAEFDELKKLVKGHNPNADLVTYSIQNLPFKILYYPGFADKYIAGAKTTKGSIYTLPDFIQYTTKGIQPALDNPFIGRDEEIKSIKNLLAANDVLILTGSPGVGKSKLAIHIAESFEKELGFEPRVLASSPVPLWDDLQNFILPDKKYFILFDDANKALPNLDYLLQFLQTRDAESTKVIITVRDYVRQDLNKIIFDKKFNETTIKIFDDKQIKEIVNSIVPAGKSIDPPTMERIATLSKGNSRLALMATKLIIENNNIEALKDTTSLYDEYFKKVQHEVQFLSKPEYLQALGILSFFGVLDRNNEELKKNLKLDFNIDWDRIWEIYIELEQQEIVDVFSKEVSKISDQILATYVFYKAFIEENTAVINYSKWIENFLTNYNGKINKSLIDIINTFGFNELRDRITSLILPVQEKIESDHELSYKFYSIFWFYREMDTLLFIKKWVESLDNEEMEAKDIKFEYANNDFVWPTENINLLLNYWHHATPLTKEALEITLTLAFKQPSRIPELLKHLNEHISYQRYDYRNNFIRQHIFIDELIKPGYSVKQQFIADKIFLAKASSFLGWDYHQVEGKGNGQMVIYNFNLFKTKSLMELRTKILLRLFSLFGIYEDQIIEILQKYAWTSRDFDATIYYDEQKLISDFFKANFHHGKYSHCKLVHKYVEALNEHSITIIEDWKDFIASESINIASVFTWSFDDYEGDYTEREKKKKEQIEKLVDGKNLAFIENILRQVQGIYNDGQMNNDTHSIDTSIANMFNAIADKDTKLLFSSLELIMQGKFDFNMYNGNIIFYPVRKKLVDSKEFYNHINRYDYKQKQLWKQMFFEAVEEDQIDEFLLQEFVGFIFSVTDYFNTYNLSVFDKFTTIFNKSKSKLPPSAANHDNIISYVTEILLSKTKEVRISFDRQICEKNHTFFKDKISLLKQVYFYQKSYDRNFDYNGKEMEAISMLDPMFLIEYLAESTKDTNFISGRFDNLQLGFIWSLPDYEKILDDAIEIILPKAPLWSNMEHPLNVLFKKMKLKRAEQKKAHDYISKFIVKHYNSEQHILIILNVITYSFNSEILKFFREFLLLNKNPSILKSLWLEKNDVISGSRVPKIEAHINFLKQLIEMVKALPEPLSYAAHIKHWEREMEWAKKDKLEETKRDFTGWMD